MIVPFGLVLRRGLSETLGAAEPAPEHAPGGHLRVAALALIVLAAATTVTYVLQYLTIYATATLHMPTRLGFGATAVLGLTGMIFAPLGGWLSDRFGRRPVMIIPMSLLLILTLPGFLGIVQFRNVAWLLGVAAVLSCISAVAFGAMLAAIAEGLPQRARSGTLALVYAVAIAAFGGSAQFNVAWLTGFTHNDLAPAFYMAAGVAMGLMAMLGLRETAPVRTTRA